MKSYPLECFTAKMPFAKTIVALCFLTTSILNCPVDGQEKIELPDGSAVYAYTIKEGTGRDLNEESRLRYVPKNVRLQSFEFPLMVHTVDAIPKERLPIFQNDRYLRNMDFVKSQRDELDQIRKDLALDFQKEFNEKIGEDSEISEQGQKSISKAIASKLADAQEAAFALLLPHQVEAFENTLFLNEHRRRGNYMLLSGTVAQELRLSTVQKSKIESVLEASHDELKVLKEQLDSDIETLKSEAKSRIFAQLEPSQRQSLEALFGTGNSSQALEPDNDQTTDK